MSELVRRPLWMVLLLVAGCASQPRSSSPSSTSPVRTASPPPPTARVTGTVLFTGKVPPPRVVTPPKGLAASVPAGMTLQPYQVGTNAGLADVLVYIENPPPPSERPMFKLGEVTMVISNTVCHPVLLAAMTRQPVRFRVVGGPMLNLHAGTRSGQDWNQAAPPGTEFVRSFEHPDLHIRITDNNVLWMVGRIAVLDHPWFAVTDASGRFSLPALPPGRYTLGTLHRRCAHQTLVVDVPASGTSVTFNMSAESATP